MIRDIRTVYSNYGFATKILAASIRSPQHVVEVAKSGADIATLPVKVFRQLFSHPLTDLGLSCVMDCIVNCGWEFAVGYIKLLSGYSMTDMRSWAVA
ncbi:MAG: transaldolase family protein [Aaplasma endosymbiont of Hyalomma asiaticum]